MRWVSPLTQKTHIWPLNCVWTRGLTLKSGADFLPRSIFFSLLWCIFFSKLTNTYLASNLKSALELTLDWKQFWLKVLLTIFNWHKCIAIWFSKILNFCCLLTQKMIKWMKSNRIYLVLITSAFFFLFVLLKTRVFFIFCIFFSVDKYKAI